MNARRQQDSATRRRRRGAIVTLGALLAGALAAPASAETLYVAAAASLRAPVETLADAYRADNPGADVRLAFGASSTLARQIEHGAPTAVFLSADPRLVDALRAGGHLAPGAAQPIARNRLVVIRAGASDLLVGRARDLAQPEVRRLAMPAEAVPLGRYAREWLAARGVLDALATRVVSTEHARATLGAVDAGHADAAIVYATDARTARRARVAYTIPDSEQPDILYVAARTRRASAEATRFVGRLIGDEAARTFAAAGFVPVEGGRVARAGAR